MGRYLCLIDKYNHVLSNNRQGLVKFLANGKPY